MLLDPKSRVRFPCGANVTFFSKRKVLTQNGRLSPFFLLVAFRDRNTYLSSLVASSQQLKHVEYSDSFLIAQVKQRPTIAHVVYLDRYLPMYCDAGFSRPHTDQAGLDQYVGSLLVWPM
uniref:Uncharacterized protein n=1 Tax=Cacopsylla melanoneura TaxID=428564 RepID=A0A8D8QS46_9HEMI